VARRRPFSVAVPLLVAALVAAQPVARADGPPDAELTDEKPAIAPFPAEVVAPAPPVAGSSPSRIAGPSPSPADSVAPLPRYVAPPFKYRLAIGGQVGLTFPLGVWGILSFGAPGKHAGRTRYAIDLLWEPSHDIQSYSAGASYHIADRMFFLGLRFRLVENHAPWARGYSAPSDNLFGLGFEAGLRAPLGWQRRWLVTFSIGATVLPATALSLSPLVTLNFGFGYNVGSW
jgi:hypothetical protein